MTRGMNNGRKLKIRRYVDIVAENKLLDARLTEALALLKETVQGSASSDEWKRRRDTLLTRGD